MNTTTRLTTLLIFVLCGAAGCGETERSPETHQWPSIQSQHEAISECGGFTRAETPDDRADSYCDAEVLDWEYVSLTEALTLMNNRVLLNCCGDRSMEAEIVDGVYVITERDQPLAAEGRCDCECVFDFDLTITGIPEDSSTIALRLERNIEEFSVPFIAWEGTLDLSQGSGAIILSEEAVVCE